MTASTKIIAVTFLLAIGLSSASFAQQSYAGNSVKLTDANTDDIVDENSNAKTVNVADALIVSKFSSLFTNATNLKWANSTDNCWVSFLNNNRKAKASFTSKGILNYIITDCAMENLPAALIKTITNNYASYHLFNAIEIAAYNTLAYQAILENSTGYITLKYTADGVEEIQQVKK